MKLPSPRPRLRRKEGSKLGVLAGLVLLSACHSPRSCAPGTLFVTLSASGAGAATSLAITFVAGTQTLRSTVAYAGQASGTLSLDFPRGYPAGAPFTLTIAALDGATTLARGATTGTLPGGCDAVAVTLAPVAGDLGADLGGADLSARPPVVVGTSAVPPSMATSATPDVPAGTQAGDYLVLCVYINVANPTVTLPPDWTPLGELMSTKGFHVWWLGLRSDGGTTAPATTFGSAGTVSAALVAIRGAGASNAVDVATTPTTLMGSVTNQQIAFTAPGLTTTRAGDLLLGFFVFDSGDGGSWVTSPAGMAKALDTGSLAVFTGDATSGGNGPFDAVAAFNAGDDQFGTAMTFAIAPN